MKVIKLINEKELDKLYETSCFTWEGMSDTEENLAAIESAIRENGYDEEECVFYTYKGKLMNKSYELHGDNAYPDDLTFVSIPKFYNPIFKINYGARWFDDIVDNNERREL
jgi:hypothetical protein